MAVNRVTLTINSRQYTVVAEESIEYIERLCNYINEKVELVLTGGQNILGERPVVLAALNICDEYFKLLESDETSNEKVKKLKEENSKLKRVVSELRKEKEDADNNQISIDEAAIKSEVTAAKNDLLDANNKIKILEGHIKSLENKLKEQQEMYERREREVLEMIEKG